MTHQKTLSMIIFAIASMLTTTTGCGQQIVTHPDTPMLISKVDPWLHRVQVSAYDQETNGLIVVGWVHLNAVNGYTITKFNWTEYASERK